MAATSSPAPSGKKVEERSSLSEYQEINGKVFLYAIAGAAISLLLLYLRKRNKAA